MTHTETRDRMEVYINSKVSTARCRLGTSIILDPVRNEVHDHFLPKEKL